jgi:hypothetical protein
MMAAYSEWLAALEHSGLGHLARHSAWLYTGANLLHVLGAALVVGAIATFDVALALRRYDAAAIVGRVAIPLAACGVALQVPTGVLLLAAEARALGVNPAFFVKMTFLAIGLLNVAIFHARFGRSLRAGALNPGARALAFVSLVAWIMVLLAGRMIAYL